MRRVHGSICVEDLALGMSTVGMVHGDRGRERARAMHRRTCPYSPETRPRGDKPLSHPSLPKVSKTRISAKYLVNPHRSNPNLICERSPAPQSLIESEGPV